MDSTLYDLASGQDGILTTAQAATCGVDERELRRLVRKGEIIRLGRGVGVLAEAWPTADGPEYEVMRHRIRCNGALLLYPDAHLCGVSRLIQDDVDVWGVPLERVELVRDIRQEVLTQSYRIRPLDAITRPVGDGPVAVAAAVVQLGLDVGVTPTICSADNAIHDLHTSYALIEQTVRAVKGRARSSRLHSILPLIDARAESVGESRLRVSLTLMGYRVLVQVPIFEGSKVFARADVGIDGTNHFMEMDGKKKYRGDLGEEVVWAEKKREDRIRRKGHTMDRVIWYDLDRTKVLHARVRAALEHAEARPSTFEANQLGRTVSPKDPDHAHLARGA